MQFLAGQQKSAQTFFLGTMTLTPKQQLFVDEYLKSFNATKAAKAAGYSEHTATEIGAENLRKPHLREAIDQRLTESAMSANEVLMRLAKQARGSMADYVKIIEGGNVPMIDWAKAAKDGMLDNMSQITIEEGKITFKLYDAQAALVHLGKYHGLFAATVNIPGLPELLEACNKAGLKPSELFAMMMQEFASADTGSP